MTPSARYQQEARKRLRLKKGLDGLFFALVGGPFLVMIILNMLGMNLDPYLTQKNILGWLGLYAVLALIHARTWKCPRCEKSLARWNEKAQVLRPACRHCGLVLFPELLKNGKVTKQKLAPRPGFVAVVLLLGAGTLSFGFYVDSFQIKGIGVGILFICFLVMAALSRIKSCPHCAHASAGGAYCEHCGGRLKAPSGT